MQAIVTSSQTAKCTAQNSWYKFIVHYGLPEKILTDQGCNLESDLLKALCEIAQVKKLRTSGYHPQANGQCKCFNATLINMLGTLPEKPKSMWREQVPTLLHAYNCTKQCLQLHQTMALVLVHTTSCLDGNHICQLT